MPVAVRFARSLPVSCLTNRPYCSAMDKDDDFSAPGPSQQDDDFSAPGPSQQKKRAAGVVACDYCRRLHEKCDGNHPCDRCTRRGKECTYRADRSSKRANTGSGGPRVAGAGLSGTEYSDAKSAVFLKEALDYRGKAMRLVEATLRSPAVDEPAKLAKYQGAFVMLNFCLFLSTSRQQYEQSLQYHNFFFVCAFEFDLRSFYPFAN